MLTRLHSIFVMIYIECMSKIIANWLVKPMLRLAEDDVLPDEGIHVDCNGTESEWRNCSFQFSSDSTSCTLVPYVKCSEWE